MFALNLEIHIAKGAERHPTASHLRFIGIGSSNVDNNPICRQSCDNGTKMTYHEWLVMEPMCSLSVEPLRGPHQNICTRIGPNCGTNFQVQFTDRDLVPARTNPSVKPLLSHGPHGTTGVIARTGAPPPAHGNPPLPLRRPLSSAAGLPSQSARRARAAPPARLNAPPGALLAGSVG